MKEAGNEAELELKDKLGSWNKKIMKVSDQLNEIDKWIMQDYAKHIRKESLTLIFFQNVSLLKVIIRKLWVEISLYSWIVESFLYSKI